MEWDGGLSVRPPKLTPPPRRRPLPRQVPRPPRPDPYGDGCRVWTDEEDDGQAGEAASDASTPATAPPPASMASVRSAVDAAIADLGGRVLPKLNWSAPLDAAWLTTGNSLACTNADEVLLLLSASDRAAHDLDLATSEHGGPACEPTLALRRWHTLRPGREVRAFVAGGALVALCQRDVTQHCPGMDVERRELARAVGRLFATSVRPNFVPGGDYTFDAYVHSSGRARVVDFNPVGGTTSALLFDWADLPYGGGGGADVGRNTHEPAPDAEDASSDASSRDGDDWFSVCSSDDERGDGAKVAGGDDAGLTGAEGSNCAGLANGSAPSTCAQPAPNRLLRQRRYVQFRVVRAVGGVTPGRTLYGVPHDFVDGDTVDDLVRRLRQGELGGGGGGAAGGA